MVDLTQGFNEGMNNILTWRNRYTASEYAGKVVLNIFYRKYTMQEMWGEMQPYIDHTKGGDFAKAVTELEIIYSNTATSKVHSTLLAKLKYHPERQVGGTSYKSFGQLIKRASAGDGEAKEEIEFNYLYHLLSDKATLYWAAACSTGVDKIKAIATISGYVIEPMAIDDYSTVNKALGQLCAAPYMHNHYNPLP